MREFLAVLAIFVSDILGRFRRWLTFRRVLGIVAVLTILLLFRGLLAAGVDVFFLLGLDLGLVTEVSVLLIALAVSGRVAAVAYTAKRSFLRLKPAGLLLRRGFQRAFRSCAARPLLPPPPDDEPAAWALVLVR